MESNVRDGLIRKILFPNKLTKVYFTSLIIVLLPIVYMFVYDTGGVKYAYLHSMYIPIILACIFWGAKGGVFVAIIGGILLGPCIPINVVTGEIQHTINWMSRLVSFVLIALLVGLFSDLLKKYLTKIHHLSTHNPETGFLNLTSIYINHEMKDFLADQTNKIFIIALSWNNYNDVVNIFGRKICVSIVQKINERVNDHFPNKFKFIHSELSTMYICLQADDDEFYLKQIAHVLKKPFVVDELPFYIDYTLGLAQFNNDSDLTPFQHADIAATYSRNHDLLYTIYDECEILRTRKNLLLLGEFPHALKNNQTILFYQPKVDLKTSKAVGMEALIRWIHPTKGLLDPIEFIPLVEETQLIHPLTEFVLDTSLTKLLEFNDHKLKPKISVNISPVNLKNPGFLERIINIFEKHKVPLNMIEFEITESALMSNPDKAVFLMNSLKNYKITLSIDDFGTGYSSLAYLAKFPIDVIKIDQYFIQQLATTEGIDLIIKSIIDLSHNLGYKVIAEGIENKAMETELIKMGCDFGQGYLYSKPLNDLDILSWYENNK
jgi:EAL domain-containing protein (putative c-di-GMP-specific phosphodiesterase class I)/GGDEF domain-containing protein